MPGPKVVERQIVRAMIKDLSRCHVSRCHEFNQKAIDACNYVVPSNLTAARHFSKSQEVNKYYLYFTSVFLTSLHASSGENEKLTDLSGRTIEVNIRSVDSNQVLAIRKIDQREVKLKIDQLDKESKKIVKAWQIQSGRIPTKDFSFKLKASTNAGFINVIFKLPEGNYNASSDSSDSSESTIKIVFDRGFFTIRVWSSEEKLEKTAEILEGTIQSRLKNMSPEERENAEPLMKLVKFEHSDFEGYSIDYGVKSNSNIWRFRNRKIKVMAEIVMNSSAVSQIKPVEMPAILNTLEMDTKGSTTQ